MLAVGLSILSTGCLDTAGDGDTAGVLSVEDRPSMDTLSGLSGSGGINGFDSLSFHLYKYTVHDSMDAPLAEHLLFGWKIQDTSANQALLFNVLQGRQTLRYAVRCALAAGDSVYGGLVPETFSGQGLLVTTAAWKTAALATAKKEDLFSCMLAHLNSAGIHVPIMLSGPSVYDSPTFDGSSYDFDEALWATEITYDPDDSPSFHFYVWPSQALDEFCPINLTGVLQLRLCGTFPGSCQLTVRTDKASVCSEHNNGWTCAGRPAIQTRLRPVDVPLLYGVCL
jgi:hypothetical protein